MTTLKLTLWNIKWLDTLLKEVAKPNANLQNLRRLDGIVKVIRTIDPDILCIVEGPAGEAQIDKFVARLAGYHALKADYVPPGLDRDNAYRQKGRQWVWFLVRDALSPAPTKVALQSPKTWTAYTKQQRWDVHYWGNIESKRHGHYRHPQVLAMEWDRQNGDPLRVEFIGLHLKSKFIRKSAKDYTDFDRDDLVGTAKADAEKRRQLFVNAALKARIKLATEASDIRRYIDHRFEQDSEPAIFVLGDFNDGPGKELFERDYLFFDLVSNLQGDVFFARRFLNHCLFDADNDLRWSVRFVDPIDKARDPHILLDHILLTQALVGDDAPVKVGRRAGNVEHRIFDEINAQLPKRFAISDHRPVSCIIDINL